jgi:hypothetical protein
MNASRRKALRFSKKKIPNSHPSASSQPVFIIDFNFLLEFLAGPSVKIF